MSDSDLLLRHLDRNVLVLTWNRPERRNAWTLDLEKVYYQALRDAEDDPEVRAIVVTGAGHSFCTGMDTAVLSDISSGELDTRPQDRTPITLPMTIDKPVIAAINGACAGFGLVLALVCDLRFAAAGAKFATSFTRLGIMAEHGSAWLLPHIVGLPNAMDLLISGRTFLAEEAAELGMVNKVVAPEEVLAAAVDYAADLAANCSPLAMATTKKQVYRATEQTLDEARLAAFELWYGRMKPHPDFSEGIARLKERRPARFAPLTGAVPTSP